MLAIAAFFFSCFSCLTSVQLQLYTIKGVYYGPKNHHDSTISTRQHVSHNSTYMLWYACKIICTVTPPDKGLWPKPFPCCFTASLMISFLMHLLCVPNPSQHDPEVTMLRFFSVFKHRKKAQSVCFLCSVRITLMDGMQGLKKAVTLGKW